MKTRMQPVDAVWSKMPRVVRDLARTCGKQVRLEMEGRETELDRSVLEAIKDPLTHLVRNAVDHGIENPQDRVAAGKTAEGVLTLRAYHEAGQVHLEITEDGAGIDPQQDRRQGARAGPRLADPARRDEPARDPQPDLPARVLDRGAGHERLGPRRRHGRRQDPDRGHRRLRRRLERGRPRLDLPAHDPADAGDHPGPHDRLCGAPVRRAAGQRARAGAARRRARPRRHRAHLGRAGLPAPRHAPAAGAARRAARPRAAGLGRRGRRAGGRRRRRAGRLHRRPAGRAAAVRAGRRRRPRHPGDRRQAARPAPQGHPRVRGRHDPRRRLGRAHPRRLDPGPARQRARQRHRRRHRGRRRRRSSRSTRCSSSRSAAVAARRSRSRW